ncbi:uncharacterized protein LOC110816646 isoform X2 [Carica papaya]|uniref:uncharacterized protein LOC110816646 isoform X2 n=1 Tax=Carica papaya TaxID=3649 RepID=UPI000B8CA561|nr:uncharacterized protein LOC110816646 isoform X2 [Carica papaya]
MAKFSCCGFVRRGKKQVKGDHKRVHEGRKERRTLQITLENQVQPFESPLAPEATERAYDGEDEHEENLSMKRDFSDFNLQAHIANDSGEVESDLKARNSDSFEFKVSENYVKGAECSEKDVDRTQAGHLSDPGTGKATFWASPKLKRSCSNLETREVLRKVARSLPPSKSQSFDELQELSTRMRDNFDLGSPRSVMTHWSADRVILKKHSSSQVLPSRSRRLWWKLFLWSHRNLHNSHPPKPQPLPTAALNQQSGYCSDTLEPNREMKLGKTGSPGSFTEESLNKGYNNHYNDKQSWGGFHGASSSLWPQNHWVAFSAESSSLTRVDEWVRDLSMQNPPPAENEDENDRGLNFPPSPDAGKSVARDRASSSIQHPDLNISEEIVHANSIIQSLNSSSTVAHISGIGLRAMPIMSCFSSLRSVNLSNNFIVRITPGYLPKGLHVLNLSRNKISTIEGLRELNRLRVLDLSYNRISRIGQGLSNCTLIKELYLAGNKISDVEGLHRLLKLTVLDLSFNKITTTKALGQLVANYNSLLALNLLGNPIQSNISDDQLRKAVCSLLSKLVYLNKQPIKPQRAREVLTDSVAKAALGNSALSSRRKTIRRGIQGASSSSGGHRRSPSVGQRTRHRSKTRTHHQFTQKTVPSAARASSSH